MYRIYERLVISKFFGFFSPARRPYFGAPYVGEYHPDSQVCSTICQP